MNLLRRVAHAIALLLERLLSEPPPSAAPPALPAGIGADVDYHVVAVDEQRITLAPASGDAPAVEVSPSALAPLVVGDGPMRVASARAAGPPYLIADFSHWDGEVDVDALVADRRYVGVYVKLTQGTLYAEEAYGRNLFRRLVDAARRAERLGVDFFVGVYAFVSFDRSGVAQAAYLHRAAKACGYLDLPPGARLRAMMDVERGQPGSPNYDDDGAKVTRCATAFASEWRRLAGSPCVAYGRGAWRDLGLRGLLGCDGLVNPDYTRNMHPMDAYGVPRSAIVAQQYTDGVANRTDLPTLPPGSKRGDTSVVLGPRRGELADLPTVRARLTW